MKTINTLFGRSAVTEVKAGGTYSYHFALKVSSCVE
jgi:hypothetical protein